MYLGKYPDIFRAYTLPHSIETSLEKLDDICKGFLYINAENQIYPAAKHLYDIRHHMYAIKET